MDKKPDNGFAGSVFFIIVLPVVLISLGGGDAKVYLVGVGLWAVLMLSCWVAFVALCALLNASGK